MNLNSINDKLASKINRIARSVTSAWRSRSPEEEEKHKNGIANLKSLISQYNDPATKAEDKNNLMLKISAQGHWDGSIATDFKKLLDEFADKAVNGQLPGMSAEDIDLLLEFIGGSRAASSETLKKVAEYAFVSNKNEALNAVLDNANFKFDDLKELYDICNDETKAIIRRKKNYIDGVTNEKIVSEFDASKMGEYVSALIELKKNRKRWWESSYYLLVKKGMKDKVKIDDELFKKLCETGILKEYEINKYLNDIGKGFDALLDNINNEGKLVFNLVKKYCDEKYSGLYTLKTSPKADNTELQVVILVDSEEHEWDPDEHKINVTTTAKEINIAVEGSVDNGQHAIKGWIKGKPKREDKFDELPEGSYDSAFAEKNVAKESQAKDIVYDAMDSIINSLMEDVKSAEADSLDKADREYRSWKRSLYSSASTDKLIKMAMKTLSVLEPKLGLDK